MSDGEGDGGYGFDCSLLQVKILKLQHPYLKSWRGIELSIVNWILCYITQNKTLRR